MPMGFNQMGQETPLWAKWMFRITMLLTTGITVFVAGTQLLPEAYKYEVMLILKAIDPIMYGISKMFGVPITETPKTE